MQYMRSYASITLDDGQDITMRPSVKLGQFFATKTSEYSEMLVLIISTRKLYSVQDVVIKYEYGGINYCNIVRAQLGFQKKQQRNRDSIEKW